MQKPNLLNTNYSKKNHHIDSEVIMIIPDFKYHRPETLDEACRLLDESPNGAAIAGGTDLLVEIKQGLRQHDDIVSLSKIDGLRNITEDEENIYIGACVTHHELTGSEIIQRNIPALADAAMAIGNRQVRNVGTIGGNLCTCASCADTGPVLLAYRAVTKIAGPNGTRQMPLSDFFIFHHKSILEKSELLTKIIIKKTGGNTGGSFIKFGLRQAVTISVASAAARITIEDGKCTDACIVTGAVAPTPMISPKAGKSLIGKSMDELSEGSSAIDEAGQLAADESVPIDDIRGTAEYRKDIAKELTIRAIIKALERIDN